MQTVNAWLALATLGLSGLSLAHGTDSPVYGDDPLPALESLDSNLRFMGGIGVGLGLVLLWITPHIERHTSPFRLIWFCALLGGGGRIVSWMDVGQPPMPMVVFTAVEVVVVPILFVWQARIARTARLIR